MGVGNTCVKGKYEGLYFVDKDNLDCYYKDGKIELLANLSDLEDWQYDIETSYDNYSYFVERFCEDFNKKFPSFKTVQTTNGGIIMENKLFQIEIEDNEWSYAVKLIQKEANYDEPSFYGLQKKHYQKYLNGMKNCLFNQFEILGIYKGAWTSGFISKESLVA